MANSNEGLFDKLFYLTCEYGINKVRPKRNKKMRFLLFMMFVHKGWKKAQKIVLHEVLSNHDDTVKAKKALKEARSNHNRNQVKKISTQIKRLEYDSKKLRMVIDSIIWTVCNLDHHIVRRFFLDGQVDNVDPKSLELCNKFIRQHNRNPFEIALYSDLTTFVHVGDVVLARPLFRQVGIVELKTGKANEQCRSILDGIPDSDDKLHKIENVASGMDKHLGKQLKRMAKQDWRAQKVVEAIANDGGIDIGTEKALKISKKRYFVETYEDDIVQLYEKTKKSSWAISVIDDCLFIGLYTDHRMAHAAFDLWVKEFDPYATIIDYRQVYSMNLARPPFSQTLPAEIIKGLVNETLFLKMSINIPKWIDHVNGIFGASLDFETKKETSRIKRNQEVFVYNKRAIKQETKEFSGHLGWGFFSKIFFDFYRPVDSGKVLVEAP